MRFAIAVLACALAVANGQFNRGAYNNFGYGNAGQYRPGQYQQGQYQQGQYNRFPQYNNKYTPFNNQPYKPFVNPTPKPVVKVVEPVKPAAVVSGQTAPLPYVVDKPLAPPAVAARVVSDERNAETLKSGYELAEDGTYNYFFETNNGIAAQSQGTPRNFGGNPPLVPDVAQGSFSWISPEGRTISVTYVADENGYQPQSDALPVAPPVPEQIARALAYIASRTVKTVN